MIIKGAGFGSYGDQVKNQQKLIFNESSEFKKMEGVRSIDDVPVPFWKLTVGGEQVINEAKKQKYYRFKFEVSLNSFEDAKGYLTDLEAAKDFDLITMRYKSDISNVSDISDEMEQEQQVKIADKVLGAVNRDTSFGEDEDDDGELPF